MRFLVALLAFAGAFGQPAQSLSSPEWTKPFPPFRMIGNVYWVGTYDLSSYLITTPAGDILINTGLADSVPQIQTGIEKLGFKLSDVKILTATHAHFDHAAGLAEMKRLTGARVMMSEPDAGLLESGGKSDFRFGKDPGAWFVPVHVDRRLKDGDKVELGGVAVTVHIQGGHTPGATSFTFDVPENNRVYRVGIINMASINPGVNLRGMPGFPNISQVYAKTFQDQKDMKFDVWLASHAGQFGMHRKYQPGDAYNPDRFVDPQGFQASVARLEKAYRDQLAKDEAK
ncbi:MAG TPA: subclass B3 metallo-beta-lactamase [Bryobacteraceae bacterium]|nr:subclass B3 metallo-beta-lactamase [Bryobacteraceae bacterium]